MPLLILDKDQTLVRPIDGDYPIYGNQERIWSPKALEGLRFQGVRIGVASNQGGIGKHKSLPDTFAEFDELLDLFLSIETACFAPGDGESMVEVFRRGGGVYDFEEITPSWADRYRFVFHMGAFRKPNPGMLSYYRFLYESRGDSSDRDMVFVGDRDSDELAARYAGFRYLPMERVSDIACSDRLQWSQLLDLAV